MLASGAFDVIGGIALLAKNNHLAGGLFWGRPFWGVVFLIVGGVDALRRFRRDHEDAGVAGDRDPRHGRGRVRGLARAAGASRARTTTWVLVGIAVDLLILYALVVRGEGTAPKAS